MPQQLDDTIQIDLGRLSRLCALRVSLGREWEYYPRDLDVTTSPDGSTWTRQFKGDLLRRMRMPMEGRGRELHSLLRGCFHRGGVTVTRSTLGTCD